MTVQTHLIQGPDQFDLVPDAVQRLTLAAIAAFLSLHASRTAPPSIFSLDLRSRLACRRCSSDADR